VHALSIGAAVSGDRLACAGALFSDAAVSHVSANMWQIVREGFTRVSTNLAENITGMRVVTAFNRQDANVGAFNRLQDSNTENNMARHGSMGFISRCWKWCGFAGA